MSRPVSATFKREVFASETSEAFLILITIDHPDIDPPIRVTSDGVDTVSRGNTFVSFPFELTLPNEHEDRPPVARLSIDNVDRTIVKTLRAILTKPSVLMEIVLASAPNTVEASFPDFELRFAPYDSLVVEGELTIDEFGAEPFPARVFSPADFPAVHA